MRRERPHPDALFVLFAVALAITLAALVLQSGWSSPEAWVCSWLLGLTVALPVGHLYLKYIRSKQRGKVSGQDDEMPENPDD